MQRQHLPLGARGDPLKRARPPGPPHRGPQRQYIHNPRGPPQRNRKSRKWGSKASEEAGLGAPAQARPPNGRRWAQAGAPRPLRTETAAARPRGSTGGGWRGLGGAARPGWPAQGRGPRDRAVLAPSARTAATAPQGIPARTPRTPQSHPFTPRGRPRPTAPTRRKWRTPGSTKEQRPCCGAGTGPIRNREGGGRRALGGASPDGSRRPSSLGPAPWA